MRYSSKYSGLDNLYCFLGWRCSLTGVNNFRGGIIVDALQQMIYTNCWVFRQLQPAVSDKVLKNKPQKSEIEGFTSGWKVLSAVEHPDPTRPCFLDPCMSFLKFM